MTKKDIPATDPEAWIEQAFDNPGVRNRSVFRTSVKAVNTGAGMEMFIREVTERGYRALENAGVIIVFCNRDPVEILSTGKTKPL